MQILQFYHCTSAIISQDTRMSNAELTASIERTAKYFGVSVEKASQMIERADKMNKETQAKGESIKRRIFEGKYVPYISR